MPAVFIGALVARTCERTIRAADAEEVGSHNEAWLIISIRIELQILLSIWQFKNTAQAVEEFGVFIRKQFLTSPHVCTGQFIISLRNMP